MANTDIDPELRQIIKRGAELIPQVKELVAKCTATEEATGELAHAVGTVASEYLAMRKKLWDRADEPLAAEVELLLNFHQQILEQASILAFRPRGGGHWDELAGRFGDGAGDSTKRLEQLAGEY